MSTSGTERKITGCPVCDGAAQKPFVEVRQMPVICNQLYDSREEALAAAKGDLHLCFCDGCGHVFNAAFDPDRLDYTQAYENSLHFSPRFQAFAEELSRRLIDAFDLHGKQIVELGCGKGDFLRILCRMGDNTGIGFDKSYEPERGESLADERIRFINDFYSAKYPGIQADCIVCRHVLEHIERPAAFLEEVLGVSSDRGGTPIYFEVPNAMYTLRDLGIWDLIYEHCSYFTRQSLTHLYLQQGLAKVKVEAAYGGQFLSAFARCADSVRPALERSSSTDEIRRCVDRFAMCHREKIEEWNGRLSEWTDAQRRVIVWGGGSKGITFLNTVESRPSIAYLVDINPRKAGKYVPGTGQRVIGPEEVPGAGADVVIVMNPLYRDEIEDMLVSSGVRAEVFVA